MRIGLINQLNGRPDGPTPPPTWASIRERAATAERVGFDMFVFEDALLYRGEQATNGVWESGSIAAALAAVTERIHFGQSVINAPYRSPGLVAKMAETVDEISGGRYVLGIGAGNTPDSDYEAFGIAHDHRYSRFAEAIHIIHALLKHGEVDFRGTYASALRSEMVLRGPRRHGPPINIAAGGPKMLRLVAAYGDAWNWWGYDETLDEIRERIGPLLEVLDRSFEEEQRDPTSIERTFDLYMVVPEGFPSDGAGEKPVAGTAEQIAGHILALGELGFDEVRCDVYPRTPEAIEAMAPVVDLVHAG